MTSIYLNLIDNILHNNKFNGITKKMISIQLIIYYYLYII